MGDMTAGIRSVFLDERDAQEGQTIAFPWILRELNFNGKIRALDVGAGGFVGKNTTIHLLEVLGADVVAIELDGPRASALRDAYPGINVIQGDINEYEYEEGPFDLIVSDLDSSLVSLTMTKLLNPFAANLKIGGYFITLIVYDLAAYRGENPLLAASGEKRQAEFLREFYGTTRVGVDTARRALRDSQLRVIGIIDKFLGHHARGLGVGWLVTQKVRD